MDPHDEELKQEVRDLKDSDSEAGYNQIIQNDDGLDGENLEDNIDQIQVGTKRTKNPTNLEKQLDRK